MRSYCTFRIILAIRIWFARRFPEFIQHIEIDISECDINYTASLTRVVGILSGPAAFPFISCLMAFSNVSWSTIQKLKFSCGFVRFRNCIGSPLCFLSIL